MELQVRGNKTHVYVGKACQPTEQPCLIFLHGGKLDGSSWIPIARYFGAQGYTALAPDLPGHGRSEGSALTSIQAMADWLVELLDELAIAQAAIIGHSMGSLVALETASRFPDRVSRIALVGSSAPMPVSPKLIEMAREEEASAISMMNVWSHSRRGQLGGNPQPGLWMYGVNQCVMERQPGGTTPTDLVACNAYEAGETAAQAISCPALVIAGGRDQMTPARNGLRLSQLLKNSSYCTLPMAGHSMMTEDPEGLIRALSGFIAESRASV